MRRINELEVAVLQVLQYNVRVASSLFARYNTGIIVLPHRSVPYASTIPYVVSYRTSTVPCVLRCPSEVFVHTQEVFLRGERVLSCLRSFLCRFALAEGKAFAAALHVDGSGLKDLVDKQSRRALATWA